MTGLIKEYILLPALENFEDLVYTVAYGSGIPSHVKFKRCNILIWRKRGAGSLQICFKDRIYPDIIHKLLKANEDIETLRPTAYRVTRSSEAGADGVMRVEARVASIKLRRGGGSLDRAVEIMKDYLYYTTFNRVLKALDRSLRDRMMRVVDCLEDMQGYF